MPSSLPKSTHDNWSVRLVVKPQGIYFLVTDRFGISYKTDYVILEEVSAASLDSLDITDLLLARFLSANRFQVHVIRQQGKVFIRIGRYGLQGGGRGDGIFWGIAQVAAGVALAVTTGGLGAVAGAALISSGAKGATYAVSTNEADYKDEEFLRQTAVGAASGVVTGGFGMGSLLAVVAGGGAGAAASKVADKVTKDGELPSAKDVVKEVAIGSLAAGVGAVASQVSGGIANKFIGEVADDAASLGRTVVDGAVKGSSYGAAEKAATNACEGKDIADGVVGAAVSRGALAGTIAGASKLYKGNSSTGTDNGGEDGATDPNDTVTTDDATGTDTTGTDTPGTDTPGTDTPGPDTTGPDTPSAVTQSTKLQIMQQGESGVDFATTQSSLANPLQNQAGQNSFGLSPEALRAAKLRLSVVNRGQPGRGRGRGGLDFQGQTKPGQTATDARVMTVKPIKTPAVQDTAPTVVQPEVPSDAKMSSVTANNPSMRARATTHLQRVVVSGGKQDRGSDQDDSLSSVSLLLGYKLQPYKSIGCYIVDTVRLDDWLAHLSEVVSCFKHSLGDASNLNSQENYQLLIPIHLNDGYWSLLEISYSSETVTINYVDSRGCDVPADIKAIFARENSFPDTVINMQFNADLGLDKALSNTWIVETVVAIASKSQIPQVKSELEIAADRHSSLLAKRAGQSVQVDVNALRNFSFLQSGFGNMPQGHPAAAKNRSVLRKEVRV